MWDSLARVNVCCWHLADILSGSLNVRFQGQSGHGSTDALSAARKRIDILLSV